MKNLFLKLFTISITLIFFSSYALSQSGRGRGYDSYDDYGGDGGYFFYFLIAVWGFAFGSAILRLIYEAILKNGKRWFKSLLESLTFFLKVILMISFKYFIVIGLFFIGFELFDKLDIKIPKYFDYIGRLIMCLLWLVIIRYLFFNHKSSDEIISFFKTTKGIVVGVFIFLLVIILIFG